MRRTSGFTLIEMLVAITLAAVLLGLAYQGLRGGIRASAAGEAAIDATNQLRVSQEFLRRVISRALPLAYAQSDRGDRRVFEGEAERIQFVAPMPGYLGKGGAYVQLVEIANGPNGQELLFSHRLLNGFDSEEPMNDEDHPAVVLIDGLEDAKFEFKGFDDQGKIEKKWSSDWEKSYQTPQLVRLTAKLKKDGPLEFPDLNIALAIDPSATQGMSAGDPRFTTQ
jgi:general secretion pathway protein J